MAELAPQLTWVQQWVQEQMRRQAATAIMEANIAQMAAEYGKKEDDETDHLTPMQKWWKQCVDLDKEMKRDKARYLESYEKARAEQAQNEIKAREYTKNEGLDDWLMVLEDGIMENLEEDKNAWLKAHRKRVIEKAKDMRAKKKRILEAEAPQGLMERAKAPTNSFISEEAAEQYIE